MSLVLGLSMKFAAECLKHNARLDAGLLMQEASPAITPALLGELGFVGVLDADDMNIRGHQLYVALMDFCHGDILHLRALVYARSQKLVDFLNGYPGLQDYPKTVKHGASRR